MEDSQMKKAGLIGIAVLLLVTATMAQGNQNSAGSGTNAITESIPVIPGVAEIKGPNRGDTRIAREVRHELLMLPYYSLFDDLRYRVNGSTVDLLGDVNTPSLKGDAEAAVKRIEGVEKVNNQINILPPSSSDDRIRQRTARAIFSFGGLSRYGWEAAPSIHIIVKNGRTTLLGVVDSEADKNAAGIRANGVPGVFNVTNNLVVAKR
jgi:hyperosmotically inducible periplasmic protein